MAQLSEHPSVKRFYQERANGVEAPADQVLDAAWLRQLCLDAGADDVGFVERDRPEIADQKADIDNVFPRTRTLISIVCSYEPGEHPDASPFNLQSRIPSHDRRNQRSGPPNRLGTGRGWDWRDQWRSRWVPDGGRSLGIKNVGDLPQACSGGGGPRTDGDSSQRDSSQVREFHSAGNGTGGCRSLRIFTPDRL